MLPFSATCRRGSSWSKTAGRAQPPSTCPWSNRAERSATCSPSWSSIWAASPAASSSRWRHRASRDRSPSKSRARRCSGASTWAGDRTGLRSRSDSHSRRSRPRRRCPRTRRPVPKTQAEEVAEDPRSGRTLDALRARRGSDQRLRLETLRFDVEATVSDCAAKGRSRWRSRSAGPTRPPWSMTPLPPEPGPPLQLVLQGTRAALGRRATG